MSSFATPTAVWHLEEEDPLEVRKDATGNNFDLSVKDGTATGAGTTIEPEPDGIQGGANQFAYWANSDHLSIPYGDTRIANLNPENADWSLSFWLKFPSDSDLVTGGNVFSFFGRGAFFLTFESTPSKTLRLTIREDNGGGLPISHKLDWSYAAAIPSTEVWHHIACTYDQETGLTRIYHNGSVVAETTIAVTSPVSTPANTSLTVGRSIEAALDELILWNGYTLAEADLSRLSGQQTYPFDSIPDIAAAVEALLQEKAAELPLAFSSSRSYLPQHTLEQLASLRVSVAPTTFRLERMHRGGRELDPTIDIGIQQKLDDVTDLTESDPLMRFSEGVAELLHKYPRLLPTVSLVRVEASDPTPDHAMLLDHSVFAAILRVTYKRAR